LGLLGRSVRFLAEPCRIHLGLFSVSPCTGGLCLALAGVQFHHFRLAANFGCLFPVCFIPFLLHGLPAPPGRQQQHNQHHHNNGNYHPNPWSCFQISHHFPLDVTGQARAIPADTLEPL
jgi:hypothetical protein